VTPLVHLVDSRWVITYISSDDGLIHDNREAPDLRTAMNRARLVAWKQGRK